MTRKLNQDPHFILCFVLSKIRYLVWAYYKEKHDTTFFYFIFCSIESKMPLALSFPGHWTFFDLITRNRKHFGGEKKSFWNVVARKLFAHSRKRINFLSLAKEIVLGRRERDQKIVQSFFTYNLSVTFQYFKVSLLHFHRKVFSRFLCVENQIYWRNKQMLLGGKNFGFWRKEDEA